MIDGKISDRRPIGLINDDRSIVELREHVAPGCRPKRALSFVILECEAARAHLHVCERGPEVSELGERLITDFDARLANELAAEHLVKTPRGVIAQHPHTKRSIAALIE